MKVSEPWRAFWPAFTVTGSAGDTPGSAWERLGALPTNLGVLAICLGAPRITVEQSGKNNIFFGNAAGSPGNHSYYLLFNDF
jgi:hypothetical protein